MYIDSAERLISLVLILALILVTIVILRWILERAICAITDR